MERTQLGGLLLLLLLLVRAAWCLYPREQLDAKPNSWRRQGASWKPRLRRSSSGSEVQPGTDDGTCQQAMAFDHILQMNTFQVRHQWKQQLDMVTLTVIAMGSLSIGYKDGVQAAPL